MTSIERLVTIRARAWERRGAGQQEDLEQEGRIALFQGLSGYDPEEGASIEVFARRILDHRFGNLLRDVLAQKRRPHVREVRPDGTISLTSCQTIALDPFPDEGRGIDLPAGEPTPEEVAIRAEHLARVARVLAAARANLTPEEDRIVECYLSPPPALLIAARNVGGRVEKTSDIALFLGVPRRSVENAIRLVRRRAIEAARRELG